MTLRIILAALMVALLAVPVQAERKRKQDTTSQPANADTQKKRAADDKAYRSALDRIPNQKPADPWGVVR